MSKIPCEYVGGVLTTERIISEAVASITGGNNGTFTFTIPSKTGYTPVQLTMMNYVSGGSAQPLIPLGICFQLSSSTSSVTTYAKNATSNTISNVKAQAVVLYQR